MSVVHGYCVYIARIDELTISDADGVPLRNDSVVLVNSRLMCSTPYELNYTFYWTGVYLDEKREIKVVGNTLTLGDVGPFNCQCNCYMKSGQKTRTSTCRTSRSITGTVSPLGTMIVKLGL